MDDFSDRAGIYIVAGLIIGASIMALGYGWPLFQATDLSGLFGAKPLLEYILAFATLGTAGAAAYFAGKSLRINAEQALSGRFQKGLEFLASDKETARCAGIVILGEIIRLRPEQFLRPAVEAFIAHINEDGEKVNLSRDIFDLDQPIGQLSVLRAFSQIVDISPDLMREHAYRPTGYVNLATVRFNNTALMDKHIENVDAIFVFSNDSIFLRCHFEGCNILICAVDGETKFHDCSFANCTFHFLEEDSFGDLEFFGDCRVINCTFCDEEVDDVSDIESLVEAIHSLRMPVATVVENPAQAKAKAAKDADAPSTKAKHPPKTPKER